MVRVEQFAMSVPTYYTPSCRRVRVSWRAANRLVTVSGSTSISGWMYMTASPVNRSPLVSHGIPQAPFTRYSLLSNRLSNRFYNRLNVCIHDTAGSLTTGCIVKTGYQVRFQQFRSVKSAFGSACRYRQRGDICSKVRRFSNRVGATWYVQSMEWRLGSFLHRHSKADVIPLFELALHFCYRC